MKEPVGKMKLMNLNFQHEGCKGKITGEEFQKRQQIFNKMMQEKKLIGDHLFCPFCGGIWKLNPVYVGMYDELENPTKAEEIKENQKIPDSEY